MKPLYPVALSLGIAAAALALHPAAGTAAALQATGPQNLKVHNKASESITVRILHSDGDLQKQETIKPGETHRFVFDFCMTCCGNTKDRQFEVRTGSTVRLTGKLHMVTRTAFDEDTGVPFCEGDNQMTVVDENTGDVWKYSTGLENKHQTAILTVTNATT